MFFTSTVESHLQTKFFEGVDDQFSLLRNLGLQLGSAALESHALA